MDDTSYLNMKLILPIDPPFPSGTEHLGKIRFHMVFTLLVNSLKKFFKQIKISKYNCFKKMFNFFILTATINIKIHKTKFKVGCSYKVCNQFVL